MKKGGLILIFVFIAFSFVSAFNFEDRGYGLGAGPPVFITFDNNTGFVNKSNFWDDLDTPADILFDDLTWSFGDNWNFIFNNKFYWNETKLTTQFFNASTIQVVTGTPQGSIVDIRSYNEISYNVSEVASDFELIVNFTDIEDFNQLIIRHKSDEDAEPHVVQVQIWDIDLNDWESYGTLSAEDVYHIVVFGIFDADHHIDTHGTVQVRFFQDGGLPPRTHKHNFDWVAIAKGFGTPAGEEIDPIFETWLGKPVFENNVNGSLVNATFYLGNFTEVCIGSCYNSTDFQNLYNHTSAVTLQQAYDSGDTIEIGVGENLVIKGFRGSNIFNITQDFIDIRSGGNLDIISSENLNITAGGNIDISISDENDINIVLDAGAGQVVLMVLESDLGEIFSITADRGVEGGGYTYSTTWLPLDDNIYDLGNIGSRWKDLYLAGTIKGTGSGESLYMNASSGNVRFNFGKFNISDGNLDMSNLSAYLGNFTEVCIGSCYNSTDFENLYNHTLSVFDLWGKWFYNQSDGSYNATYAGFNTTSNLQGLLNSTGIYSTYNLTYAGSVNNFSYLRTDNSSYRLGDNNTFHGNADIHDGNLSMEGNEIKEVSKINLTIGYIQSNSTELKIYHPNRIVLEVG